MGNDSELDRFIRVEIPESFFKKLQDKAKKEGRSCHDKANHILQDYLRGV